ncbi:MAG: BACON domain-containing protein [bacterium]
MNTFFFGQNGYLGSVFLTVTPTSISKSGSSGSFNIYITSNISWNVSTTDSWLTVISGGSGTNNGTTFIGIDENNSGSSRNSTISIDGEYNLSENVSVTQISDSIPGPGSDYIILDPSSYDDDGLGTNINGVDISVSSNVNWTAESDRSWITINTGGSGSGNGTTNISILQNNTGFPRGGQINYKKDDDVLATFTIVQDSQ